MSTRAAPRVGAALLASLLTVACANADLNPIAPGSEPPKPAIVPDAIDVHVSGFIVHLDPSVLVWAHDVHIDLQTEMRRVVTRAENELHGLPTQVSVSAGSYRVIPDVGIGGSTDARTGEVIVSMDSRSPVPLRTMLTTWLPIAITHELHHSERILDGPGLGTTLLDAIVAEGSAEAFVRAVYPHAPPIPWVQPLSPSGERAAWRAAKGHLHDTVDPGVYERWFLGNGALPRWAGYRVGYEIARSWLARHTSENAASLALVASTDVLAQSGYAPRVA